MRQEYHSLVYHRLEVVCRNLFRGRSRIVIDALRIVAACTHDRNRTHVVWRYETIPYPSVQIFTCLRLVRITDFVAYIMDNHRHRVTKEPWDTNLPGRKWKPTDIGLMLIIGYITFNYSEAKQFDISYTNSYGFISPVWTNCEQCGVPALDFCSRAICLELSLIKQ